MEDKAKKFVNLMLWELSDYRQPVGFYNLDRKGREKAGGAVKEGWLTGLTLQGDLEDLLQNGKTA
ncbi:hypothetical protein D7X94_10140 [Acutalibacter sp. 1XD8-33]|nr:hypothetical protein D7X94_10140 [Acutalibacter sp. 1XD8-33]